MYVPLFAVLVAKGIIKWLAWNLSSIPFDPDRNSGNEDASRQLFSRSTVRVQYTVYMYTVVVSPPEFVIN